MDKAMLSTRRRLARDERDLKAERMSL